MQGPGQLGNQAGGAQGQRLTPCVLPILLRFPSRPLLPAPCPATVPTPSFPHSDWESQPPSSGQPSPVRASPRCAQCQPGRSPERPRGRRRGSLGSAAYCSGTCVLQTSSPALDPGKLSLGQRATLPLPWSHSLPGPRPLPPPPPSSLPQPSPPCCSSQGEGLLSVPWAK